MLEQLKYSVTFPTTGRTLAGDVELEQGFGIITGANEAGKSFIIEVVRWCLFGSAALRGKAEDYKTLKATLTFTVKGETYVVERGSTTAKLTKGDLAIAAGVKPVNAHIISLLGFGLEVFDVACSANQGDIERLGTMKPTERKRMVDQVLGMDRLDDTAKWCGDEAKVFERHPDPGVEPKPPSETMGDIEAARAAYDELQQLRGRLSVVRTEPKAPTCSVAMSSEDLRPLAEAERDLHAELAMLHKRLQGLPQPSPYSDDELDTLSRINENYTLWRMRQEFERRHPRSSYHREQLLVMRDDWAVIGQRDSLGRLIRELESHGEVDCPSCQHHFFLEEGKLDDLREKLSALQDISKPELTLAEINAEMGKLDDWSLKATQDEWACLEHVVEIPAPTVTLKQIDEYRRANAAGATRAQIEARIAEIGTPSNQYQAALETRLAYEAAYARWEKDFADYLAWAADDGLARIRADELAWAVTELPRLTKLQGDWVAYNIAYRLWQVRDRDAKAAQTQAQGWRAAQNAIGDLRTLVKGHLVPALSRVASGLLAQMTGGQRNHIQVDEDFDVTVDGQMLSTLSGSGKAVANLALRLGLGQVLTNGVLSLFIGDEIDASMDDNRAGNMTNTVRSLAQKISQIIIITHKYPVDADWHINLGMENGSQN